MSTSRMSLKRHRLRKLEISEVRSKVACQHGLPVLIAVNFTAKMLTEIEGMLARLDLEDSRHLLPLSTVLSVAATRSGSSRRCRAENRRSKSISYDVCRGVGMCVPR